MFKNIFSFEGRIARLEYGLTIVIYIVLYVITLYLIDTIPLVGLLLLIATVWFLWAQGAKRCHDIGKSGWMQIVPFYFLFLIFQNSENGPNPYGNQKNNPEPETLDGHLRE